MGFLKQLPYQPEPYGDPQRKGALTIKMVVPEVERLWTMAVSGSKVIIRAAEADECAV